MSTKTPSIVVGHSWGRTTDRRRQRSLPESAGRAALLEDMIRFARRWGDFEGDEYIFPEFGISPDTFYRRLYIALRDRSVIVSDPRTFTDLLDLCRSRIDAERR